MKQIDVSKEESKKLALRLKMAKEKLIKFEELTERQEVHVSEWWMTPVDCTKKHKFWNVLFIYHWTGKNIEWYITNLWWSIWFLSCSTYWWVICCFRIENIWLYWIDIEEYGRCITTWIRTWPYCKYKWCDGQRLFMVQATFTFIIQDNC